MITPIDGRHLNLVRGGAAANAARLQPPAQHDDTPENRSPLARNVESLVLDAYEAGRGHGERQHYMSGWRWGYVCGLLAGIVSGASVVLLLQWAGLL